MDRNLDEIDVLLGMWTDWMFRDEPIAEGYPSKASGGFIPSWRKDDQDTDDAIESATVEKVNACYESLGRYYQDPIDRHYGLGFRVWRFQNGGATFEDAKSAIRPLFVKKGLL